VRGRLAFDPTLLTGEEEAASIRRGAAQADQTLETLHFLPERAHFSLGLGKLGREDLDLALALLELLGKMNVLLVGCVFISLPLSSLKFI
jgi:hypothetical protein